MIRVSRRAVRWFRPRLQLLEARTVPALFTVTNLNDSGAGSLRQAMINANGAAGTDTINFTVTGTINLTSGQLFSSGGLLIDGPGADKLTIKQTTTNARVFDVNSTAPNTYSGLTISGGNGVNGAGARVLGTTLTLDGCELQQNSGLDGGGVWAAGSLAAVNCLSTTFLLNTASGNGGGIFATTGASVSLTDCSLNSNDAANGGAVYVQDGDLKLNRSTLIFNTATFDGGAVFLASPPEVFGTSFVLSTVSNNDAGRFGGGFFLFDLNDGKQPVIDITNLTIVDNDAQFGGGIYISGSKASIEGTIVARNKASMSDGPDAYLFGELSAKTSALGAAPFVAAGDPLFAFLDQGGNLAFGLNLKLSPIGNQGGPTSTHLPLPGSPLIDAGSNVGAPSAVDQRLMPQPNNGVKDIGSVEVQQIFVTSTADAGVGSLRQAIIDANAQPGPDHIRFDESIFSSAKTISLLTVLPVISERVYLSGTGVDQLTVRRDPGAGNFRVFTISNKAFDAVQITDMTITGGMSNIDGGGIIVDIDSSLVLRRVAVTGNTTTFDGGGIAAWANSRLEIFESTISGNTSGVTSADDGGGVYSIGSLVGVYSSTIWGNSTSAGRGGGLYMGPSGGMMVIAGSTISGNSAAAGGGGVFLGEFPQIRVLGSTVTNNNSASGGGGGGISRVPASSAYFEVFNSIVSGNTNAFGPNIFAQGVVNADYSVIGSSTGITITGSNNLPAGTNLKLGPLANNGGTTLTHLPAFDSPLVNSGRVLPGTLVGFDQRGYGAPIGPALDIGSVEVGLFVVTNANDDGPGSLREALVLANTFIGPDRIEFDPTFFSSKRTIKLTTDELLVADSVTIVGPGQSLLTISGESARRVFRVDGPGTIQVEMSGLTIANGTTTGEGAGLLVENEKLSLIDCTITNNTANQDGGGIEMNATGGQLTLLRCTVSNNTALNSTFDGGGIDTEATGISVVVIDSTISGNKSGGEGGGVFIAAGSTLEMRGSTVVNNEATGTGGGGICIDGSANQSYIINSTITGNHASANGGGLFVTSSFLSAFVFNSTIVGNTAGLKGGGIALTNPAANIDVRSSVISGNSAPTGPDAFSATVLAQVSLFGSTAGITTFNADATSTNLVGKNPLLGPLTSNGGPTQTMLPRPGSPLLDVGAANGETVDQRGLLRNSFGVDIGATELQQIVVSNTTNAAAGSLRSALTTAIAQTGPEWIRFDPVVFASASTITLDSTLPTVNSSVFITGPAADRLTVLRNSTAGNFRLLTISGSTTEVVVTGMTLSGGKTLAATGAGISVGLGSSLELDSVMVLNNIAQGADGGGIDVSSIGKLTIRNSTVVGNSATSSGSGGGISFGGSFLLIENSTISGNQLASGSGGGLFVDSTGTPSVTIRNSTITANSAATGGGIARSAGSTATLDVNSTIISGNTATVAPDISASGTITLDYSAVGNSAGFSFSGANNLPFAADLKLDTLKNNGGPTLTHALQVGSWAIDRGTNSAGLSFDQRGAGFTRDKFGGTDIGAFEVQSLPPPKLVEVVVNGGAVQRSRVTQISVTFDQIVTLPVNPGDAFSLRRQHDGAGVTLSGTLDNSGPGTLVTLNFTGGAIEFGSLTDGKFNLNILAAKISGFGGLFDGNGNGTGGDNLLIAGNTSTAPKLFRLFGDADGNGTVTASDFNAFRLDYGLNGSSMFDFDNNSAVNATDFNQFRVRYGVSLAP